MSEWKWVPVEPTYQMCEAMNVGWETGSGFPARYKAMLAAAPSPGVEPTPVAAPGCAMKMCAIDLPEGRKVEAALLDEGMVLFSLTGGRDDVNFVTTLRAFEAMNCAVVTLLADMAGVSDE